MKRLILALCLTIIGVSSLCAATAKINKVWLEHNVTVNNRKAMKVHCDFSVQGMKGKEGHINIWIKGPSGDWHKVNSPNKISSGVTYFSWSYNPKYDDSHFHDKWKALYIDDLRLLSGKNTYSVIVTVVDDHNKTLAQSAPATFTGTGTGSNSTPAKQSSPKQSSPSPGKQQNNRIVESRRENLSYGGFNTGFVIIDKYANGYTMRTQYGPCSLCRGTKSCNLCHGTGLCNVCHGQGGIVSAAYGTFYPCNICGQTGQCNSCKGARQCAACTGSDSKYPGYIVIGTTVTDANGQRVHNESYRSRSSEERSSGSRSSKKICPDCGGTKLWNKGKQPEFAMPRTELIAHYNKAGEKCPYCYSIESHWHSRCTTCKNYPGTDNPYK